MLIETSASVGSKINPLKPAPLSEIKIEANGKPVKAKKAPKEPATSTFLVIVSFVSIIIMGFHHHHEKNHI